MGEMYIDFMSDKLDQMIKFDKFFNVNNVSIEECRLTLERLEDLKRKLKFVEGMIECKEDIMWLRVLIGNQD